MEKLVTGIVLVLAFIFVAPLLGTLAGAFSGWVVGFFFSDTILSGLKRFGVNTDGMELWQIGAVLGFVGGFFRYSTSTKKAD